MVGGQIEGTKEGEVGEAAELYGEAAAALNSFFQKWTADLCSGCLDLYRASRPDDVIARHELVRGSFPGCCQEGVAQDCRIPDGSGTRLPARLWEEVIVRRPAVGGAAAGSIYAVREIATGKIQEGRGCVWLGAGGCLLGSWKSPICLYYLCEPVRERLGALSGSGQPLPEDFCGFAGVLAALGEALEKKGEGMSRARGAVAGLKARLEGMSEKLSEGSGGLPGLQGPSA